VPQSTIEELDVRPPQVLLEVLIAEVTRSVTRNRTELAIFLTPYVVFTDEDAEELLRRERDQLQGSRQKIDSILPVVPPTPAQKPQ